MAEREGFETDRLGSSKATAGQEDDEEEEMEVSEDESEVELEEGGGVSELQPTELRAGSSVSEAAVRGSPSETLAAPSANRSSENGQSDGRFVGKRKGKGKGIDSVSVDGLFGF